MNAGNCTYAPSVAQVRSNGAMDMIACNNTAIFVFDNKYRKLDCIAGLSAELTYAVAQDIDGDGLNEIVVSNMGGKVYAFDTLAPRPNPRVRTEVTFYSERRLNVAEYVPPLGAQTQPPSWWNKDWQYRRTVTIDHTKVTGNQIDFPVLVDITDSNFIGKAQSNGNDFVFTDSSQVQLNHEIELYDSSVGHLIAWVRVSSLSSTADTMLYVYYGNSGSANQQNPTGVWDTHFMMIQHLNEASGTLYDSTVNVNSGISQGGVSQGISGKINGATSYDGVNDYVQVANSASISGFDSAFTTSFWLKFDVTTGRQTIMNKYEASGNQRGYYIDYDSTRGLGLFISSNGISFRYWYASFSPIAGNWYYIVVVARSGAIPTFYINGQAVSTTYSSGTMTSIYDNALAPLYIGKSYTGRYFCGTIDEVRVSDAARSSDWIATEYGNQVNPSNFLS